MPGTRTSAPNRAEPSVFDGISSRSKRFPRQLRNATQALATMARPRPRCIPHDVGKGQPVGLVDHKTVRSCRNPANRRPSAAPLPGTAFPAPAAPACAQRGVSKAAGRRTAAGNLEIEIFDQPCRRPSRRRREIPPACRQPDRSACPCCHRRAPSGAGSTPTAFQSAPKFIGGDLGEARPDSLPHLGLRHRHDNPAIDTDLEERRSAPSRPSRNRPVRLAARAATPPSQWRARHRRRWRSTGNGG